LRTLGNFHKGDRFNTIATKLRLPAEEMPQQTEIIENRILLSTIFFKQIGERDECKKWRSCYVLVFPFGMGTHHFPAAQTVLIQDDE